MITHYGFDQQFIYTNPVEFDPYGPIPENTTEVEPPEVALPQVAQWQGATGWVVLNERPAYVPPEIVLPELPPLERIEFLRLFTQTERIAIREAAKTDLVIEDYQYMLDNSSLVLLSDPDIVSDVSYLEQLGLIGNGRAAQILAGVKPV